jgi:hypothetical protein
MHINAAIYQYATHQEGGPGRQQQGLAETNKGRLRHLRSGPQQRKAVKRQ